MSDFKIQMPKLGESVQEATITKWFVKEGDRIEEDQSLFEVATDKVDSEIPSPVEGIVKKIMFPLNSLVPVGETVVVITIDGEDDSTETDVDQNIVKEPEKTVDQAKKVVEEPVLVDTPFKEAMPVPNEPPKLVSSRFYSPLVLSIASAENVTMTELESILGSGINGRVQKKDILSYVDDCKKGIIAPKATSAIGKEVQKSSTPDVKISISLGSSDQIIEMDRVRKIIADHMVMSKQVSPHVTSVVEADVTNLVLWRNKVKDEFAAKYGVKITYLPERSLNFLY